jgi:hypothetical protein
MKPVFSPPQLSVTYLGINVTRIVVLYTCTGNTSDDFDYKYADISELDELNLEN